jgi:hypothetical protein
MCTKRCCNPLIDEVRYELLSVEMDAAIPDQANFPLLYISPIFSHF